ncbi:MAG: MotA/TolQ/ExbB proton channel family protein [Bacteroidales bacterium]|jgi:biopolymer transport protein ExbB|nr:MotA/TolQ/ExbB proton channel family protein [Bacteroidales bacterium]
MKKLFALLAITGILTFGISTQVMAQEDANAENVEATEDAVEEVVEEAADLETDTAVPVEQERGFHQVLKDKFIEGGAGWMAPILICLILGLAFVIERIIYLNLSTTNSKKLLMSIDDAMKNGGAEKAKEICRDTRGPLASVFYQGLDRYEEDIDIIEKSVVSYGGVQMGRLESNLVWVGLFIALAPMLGFLGTVIGMVQAFDAIEVAGDISPTVVAGGMKVALLTTVFGLIVAIILQVFYNYLVSKIESLVDTMEDATITFMDIIVKNKR